MPVIISADKYTKQKLGINEASVSESQASQLLENLKNSEEFRITQGQNTITIRRIIRD